MSPPSTGQMNIFKCMCYVIGCMIGSGIFITPSMVLKNTHSVLISFIVWAVAGLISLAGGVAYIELATGIPEDGCDFAYQTFVGWKALAFCFMLITCLFTYPGSTSVQAITFGEYIVEGLNPYFNFDISSKVYWEKGIGILLLVSCTFLNFFSLNKFASRFQAVFSILKGLILIVIVVVGAWFFFGDVGTSRLSQPMDDSSFNTGSFVMALYNALWAFAGWDILNYGVPSVKNPRKTLTVALTGSLVLVTVFYILLNFSFLVVLGPQKMINSTAIAADFAQESLGSFAFFVPFATAVMILGTVNAEIFVSSRIIYEAGRQGQLPPFLAAVNKKTGSYLSALILQLIVAILMCFVDVSTIIESISFVMWAQKLVTMVALLYIKIKKVKVHENVLRIPIFVAFFFFACLCFLVFVPIVTDFMNTLKGLGILFTPLLIYFIVIRPSKLPAFIYSVNDCLNNLTCRLLNTEIILAEKDVAKEAVIGDSSQEKAELKSLEQDDSKPTDTLLQ